MTRVLKYIDKYAFIHIDLYLVGNLILYPMLVYNTLSIFRQRSMYFNCTIYLYMSLVVMVFPNRDCNVRLECDILVIYLSLKMSLTSKEEVDCGY